MSKVHIEEKEVFGTLYTEFGTFKMLKKLPNFYDVPSILKERGFLSFYVVDVDGFAKNIFVNCNNAIIKPVSEIVTMNVNFLLDDDVEQDDN